MLEPYKVYYDDEAGGWMRSGSNRVFSTEKEAIDSAVKASKARTAYYRKEAEDIKVRYKDSYNVVVFSADMEHYDRGAGGGFYDMFSNKWDSPNYEDAYVTVNELFEEAKYNSNVMDFINRLRILSPDSKIRNAITVLMNYPEDKD